MPAEDQPPVAQPESPENGAWDAVRSGWRLLYGGFDSLGISFEWHEFSCREELDWSRSFHPDSLELCLNFRGRGQMQCGRSRAEVRPCSVIAYTQGRNAIAARRQPGEVHRFLTIELRPDYLARHVSGAEDSLDPVVRDGVLQSQPRSVVGEPRPLTMAHEPLASRLAIPPVNPAALPVWFQGMALELIAEFLFRPHEELFCERQKRVARDRVAQVKELLAAQLDAPPSLEELGRQVGVSQFYLSRTFSAETGMTIPQYLRRVRMERAAEYLGAGTHNVTEAAFAVGYASLGHFSKSFCEVLGCCPALYPHARNIISNRH